MAPGSQVERGARCDRLVAARGAAWRPPHRDGTEGDALLGGLRRSAARGRREACAHIQSWLDVQRARGGQAETAKALLFPWPRGRGARQDSAQRRLREAKEAQAQKKAAKQLEKEEKAAKAKRERRASCAEAEALRQKVEKQRKERNQRRKDARKRVKEAGQVVRCSLARTSRQSTPSSGRPTASGRQPNARRRRRRCASQGPWPRPVAAFRPPLAQRPGGPRGCGKRRHAGVSSQVRAAAPPPGQGLGAGVTAEAGTHESRALPTARARRWTGCRKPLNRQSQARQEAARVATRRRNKLWQERAEHNAGENEAGSQPPKRTRRSLFSVRQVRAVFVACLASAVLNTQTRCQVPLDDEHEEDELREPNEGLGLGLALFFFAH